MNEMNVIFGDDDIRSAQSLVEQGVLNAITSDAKDLEELAVESDMEKVFNNIEYELVSGWESGVYEVDLPGGFHLSGAMENKAADYKDEQLANWTLTKDGEVVDSEEKEGEDWHVGFFEDMKVRVNKAIGVKESQAIPGLPKTDYERLVAHFGKEKADEMVKELGDGAYEKLPPRGTRMVSKQSQALDPPVGGVTNSYAHIMKKEVLNFLYDVDNTPGRVSFKLNDKGGVVYDVGYLNDKTGDKERYQGVLTFDEKAGLWTSKSEEGLEFSDKNFMNAIWGIKVSATPDADWDAKFKAAWSRWTVYWNPGGLNHRSDEHYSAFNTDPAYAEYKGINFCAVNQWFDEKDGKFWFGDVGSKDVYPDDEMGSYQSGSFKVLNGVVSDCEGYAQNNVAWFGSASLEDGLDIKAIYSDPVQAAKVFRDEI